MPRNGSVPVSGKATIIDRGAPMTVAHTFVNSIFAGAPRPRLIRYRGTFYSWRAGVWSEIGEETTRAKIYEFLAGCSCFDKEQQLIPVKPNFRLVNEVLAALKAVVLVDDDVEPPAWLKNNSGTQRPRPNPGDIIVFKNGLLHLPTQRLLRATPEFFVLWTRSMSIGT